MNANNSRHDGTDLPPGPPALPVVGHLPNMSANPLGFYRALAYTYGPAASYYLGRQHAVLLTRPHGVGQFLVQYDRNLTTAEFNHVLRPVAEQGLFNTDGAVHRRLRRLVQPAFTGRRLDAYRDTMVAHTERMLAVWNEQTVLNIGPQMQRLTLGIVAEVVCGIERFDEADVLGRAITDAFQLSKHRFLAVAVLAVEQQATRALKPFIGEEREPGLFLDTLCKSPLARIKGSPLQKLRAARLATDEYVGSVIKRQRAAGVDRGDVISSLLTTRGEDGDMLDDQAVQDQLITLLVAGYGTTATALTWTLVLLSQHPDAAMKLRAELQRVLNGRAPTVDELEHLPFLDQVWKESLRLYPTGWYLNRFCHDDVEIEGYRLPAGTMLTVSAYVTQRMPDLFKHPNSFCPERFDPSTGEKHQQHAYFPFGAGPRMCLGAVFAAMEGKILLALMLQRFELEIVAGHPIYPEAAGVLRPARGVPMIPRLLA